MKNLTLHIVKKDLRHLWPWLVLWWATFVFAAIYPVWAFDRLMDSTAKGSDPSFILVSSLSCIILLLLVIAMLTDADSPLDDRSFWRTQPVPPARLLAAKFIFLIAFGLLVPLLIKFLTLAAYGFSWDQGWPAFQNFAQILIYGLTVLFLAASFFPRPLVGYAALIGLYLLALFIAYNAPNDIVNNFPSSPDIVWILLSLFLAILIASISCLYLRQRRRLAILILVLGLLFDIALGLFWPAGEFQPHPVTPVAVLPPFTLTPTLDLARINSLTGTDGRKTYLVTGNFSIGSLPSQPTEVWFPLWSQWKLSWPDHHPVSDAQLVYASDTLYFHGVHNINVAAFPATGFPFRFAEALQAFGVKHLLTTIDYDPTEFLNLTSAVYQRLRQSPAALTGNLTFAVSRLEEIARLPLSSNAVYRNNAGEARVGPLDNDGAVSRNGPDAIGLISVDPARYNSASDSMMFTVSVAERSAARIDGQPWFAGGEINLLINPKTGEALLGYPGMTDTSTILSDLTLARVDYVFRFQYFTASGKVYDMPDHEIESWRENAEFVRLRLVAVGRARGAFTLNPLVIPANTP